MYQVIIIAHVLVGLGVIGLVLIQHGKGADAGAAFGSGSSGTVFGAQGSASFLSRTTAILAAIFFTTSLSLAVLSGKTGNDTDIMDPPIIEEINMEVPTIDGEQPIKAIPMSSAEELPQILNEPTIIEKVAPIIQEELTTINNEVINAEENIVTP